MFLIEILWLLPGYTHDNDDNDNDFISNISTELLFVYHLYQTE